MRTRRAQLIDIRSEKPLDPKWSPTVDPEEIESANLLLNERQLPFQWRILPGTITLSGAATLHSAVSDDSIQFSPSGFGC